MKKLTLSMIALAMTAMTFTSCEDVPAPYDYPGTGGNEGGGELAEGVYLDETFTKEIENFEVITQKGTPWSVYNNKYVIGSGYDSNTGVTTESESYLVSKEIDLSESTNAHLTFEYIFRYDRGGCTNKVYITDNYSGDPTTTNWTDITGTLTEGSDWNTWYSFDENIPADFIGKKTVRIALYYACGTSSTTWELKNLKLQEGEAENTGGGNQGGEEGVATGNGTLESPFNSVAANNYASKLASGEESPEVYIKGKVVSIKEQFGTQYGNATFYISDDGTTAGQFYVFRALYLGNVKYTSGDLLKEGDEVVICGKITNYMGNTPETIQGSAYLYSLNCKTAAGGGNTGGETGKATGDGTEANPFNSVAANNYASSLAAGAESDKDVYIKGKVVSVKEQYGTQYGNATFYISDDGTTTGQFYVFRALYLNNEKYTSGELLQPGDEVVICGKVTNYMGNTPETVQGKAYLVSLKSNGGGGNEGGGEVSGNTIVVNASDLGIANGTALTTITLLDGTELSFDGGGNTNAPKYYDNGTNIRMYPKNSMKVTSQKNITKINFVVDVYNGTTCNASGDITSQPGTVSISDTNVNITNINSKSVTITDTSSTTGAASQIRIKTISITYAD